VAVARAAGTRRQHERDREDRLPRLRRRAPTILGLAFILSPVVIYPFYAAAPRVLPLSPLEDQLVAGLVMFGLGNLIYSPPSG